MCTLFVRAAVITALCSLSIAPQGRPQSEWGQTTAETLSHFLPGAIPPLVAGMKGDPGTYNKPDLSYGWGEGFTGGSFGYMPASTQQHWRFDEPELIEQAEAAKQKSQAEMARQMAAAQESQKMHAQEILQLQQQLADLARQGKYKEMQAVSDKMGALMMPGGGISDPKDQDPLRRARSLTVVITANESRLPSTGFLGGNTPGNLMKPAGTIKGHTLYHFYNDRQDYGALSAYTVLAVFLGPEQFHENFGGKRPVINQIKCISVRVNVESRPDTTRADEQTARQFLESIDFDGLSKLITR